MDVAISSLVSATLSDYAPIQSIGVKIALGSLLSRLIEHAVGKTLQVDQILGSLFGCLRKRNISVYICDYFTARALNSYINTCFRDDPEAKLQWNIDHVTVHCGTVVTVEYKNTFIQVTKLAHQESKHDVAEKKDEERTPTSFFEVSANDLKLVEEFLTHIRNTSSKCLLVHRNAACSTKKQKKDEFEDVEIEDEDNFGSLVFDTLESYFLQKEHLLSAALSYKDSTMTFAAEPSSFSRSLLCDEYLGTDVYVSFIFSGKPKSLEDEARSFRPVCLQLESQNLSVNDLRDYVEMIFKKKKAEECKRLLQKELLIHEVQLLGSKADRAKWRAVKSITCKSFENTIVSKQVQEEFIDDLAHFLLSPVAYVRTGQPYKRGYILHGPPGTGKSSLIKVVAWAHQLPLFVINLARVTGNQFNALVDEVSFRMMGRPHILAFEDVDRCSIFKSGARNRYQSDSEEEQNDAEEDKHIKRKERGVTMASLLNALDGVKEPYGRIVIFTGNNSKKFVNPPKCMQALLRPGRIDRLVEVGYCTTNQICRLWHLFFPEEKLDDSLVHSFETLSPAQLGELLMRYEKHPDIVREMLYGRRTFDAKPIDIDEEKDKTTDGAHGIVPKFAQGLHANQRRKAEIHQNL